MCVSTWSACLLLSPPTVVYCLLGVFLSLWFASSLSLTLLFVRIFSDFLVLKSLSVSSFYSLRRLVFFYIYFVLCIHTLASLAASLSLSIRMLRSLYACLKFSYSLSSLLPTQR